ncbi:MAG: ATP-binding protein [Lachnospiraceae bacterium]|jgi:predicted AAA+ superfamily ATPase|nr:ATP-binding protein [Lachnospiraceae bacterium]
MNKIIQREEYLKLLKKFKDTEFIKVITGVRRSGKTYILQMFRDYLLEHEVKESQIIYLNFESVKNKELLDWEKLYEYVVSRVIEDKKMYIFFDEIQKVEGWEQAINSFRVDFNSDIYITGSNASLLSGELATLLAGRYVEVHVYPLSFKEYLNFKNSDKNTELLFYQYIEEGGFPSVALSNNDKQVKNIISQGILDSILLRDVGARGDIRNEELLLRLTEYLMDSIGNPISANKILGTFQSDGLKIKNSQGISKYMELLVNAFIFYHVKRYDLRGKERLKTLGKYYCVDTGLRNTLLNTSGTDNLGHQIENIVYIELLRRGYSVNVGNYDKAEIDFVAKKDKNVIYIQVTSDIPKDDNRETDNLKYLRDGYEKLILTANRMNVGMKDGIKVEHIIDWLLDY